MIFYILYPIQDQQKIGKLNNNQKVDDLATKDYYDSNGQYYYYLYSYSFFSLIYLLL